MKSIQTALIQINTTVGAIAENSRKILDRTRIAAENGTQLIVFPELALTGYPPEDLILKPHFIADCEETLLRLATSIPSDVCVILGTPERLGTTTYNTAAILLNGEIVGRYRKNLLPNYGVFDEKRIFTPGEKQLFFSLNGARFAIHICEDSWYMDSVAVNSMQKCKLTALINLSASPFHQRKVIERENMISERSRDIGTYLLYANLIGGQDELVFDGASMIADSAGVVRARAKHFEEDILYYRLPFNSETDGEQCQPESLCLTLPSTTSKFAPRIEHIHEEEEEIYSALKLGLRDYLFKNGFKNALIAISGGIDSALVATLAVDALGAECVTGLTMPSQYTSDGTLTDAENLAENLGITLHTLPIRPLYDAFIDKLSPFWLDHDEDATEENLQARIRGVLIMAFSNKFGKLVISTGNKSELAVGYCTLYGDMVGGFAIIKDIPKTQVFALSRWRNRQGDSPVIPPSTITRPPSAELRADQKDSDSLPPYDILDPILERYIELDQHTDKIIAAGFDRATVERITRLVDLNEYKRRQGAPGIKITPKAFGRDRRVPITNSYRHNSK